MSTEWRAVEIALRDALAAAGAVAIGADPAYLDKTASEVVAAMRHAVEIDRRSPAPSDGAADIMGVGDLTGNVSAELIRRVYRKGNRTRTASHVDAVRAALAEEC